MRKLLFATLFAAVATPAAAQVWVNVDLDADPLPPPVRTYIVETEVPAFTVTEEIVVGAPVPENVVVRDIPDYDYHYAVINERRVLIEPETRRVVTFVDY